MGTRLSDRHAAPHGDGPGHDEETRIGPAEGFPGPAATTPWATTPIAMPQDPVAAGRPSTQGLADISDSLATRAGPSRRHGAVCRRQRPSSPVAGLRVTILAR